MYSHRVRIARTSASAWMRIVDNCSDPSRRPRSSSRDMSWRSGSSLQWSGRSIQKQCRRGRIRIDGVLFPVSGSAKAPPKRKSAYISANDQEANPIRSSSIHLRVVLCTYTTISDTAGTRKSAPTIRNPLHSSTDWDRPPIKHSLRYGLLTHEVAREHASIRATGWTRK